MIRDMALARNALLNVCEAEAEVRSAQEKRIALRARFLGVMGWTQDKAGGWLHACLDLDEPVSEGVAFRLAEQAMRMIRAVGPEETA